MKKALLSFIVAGALVFGGAEFSKADLLTWQLTGDVFQIGTPLQHIFSIGDSVDLIFTFDTDTADLQPADPAWGQYLNAITYAQVTVGSYSASIKNYGLNIFDNRFGSFDLFGFSGTTASTIFNGDNLLGSDGVTYVFEGIFGHFRDWNLNMFPSDSLNISASRIISTSDEKRFDVGWVGISNGIMNGVAVTNLQMTDITPEPIPEPTTMLLLGTGLVGVVGAARRRKK